MISHYRGYEIKVTRERALGGWENLYFYILRESDGKFMVDDFSTGKDGVREFVGYMKERIDAELLAEDPWGEAEEYAERIADGWYKVPGGWSNVPMKEQEAADGD